MDLKECNEYQKKRMQQDDDLAWGWHCNIAVNIMDSGIDHEPANRAARVMSCLFSVNMFDHWEMMYEEYTEVEGGE